MSSNNKRKNDYTKVDSSLKNYDLPKSLDSDYKSIDYTKSESKSKINILNETQKIVISNEVKQDILEQDLRNETQKIVISDEVKQDILEQDLGNETQKIKIAVAKNVNNSEHILKDPRLENTDDPVPDLEELKAEVLAEKAKKERIEDVRNMAMLFQGASLLALTSIPAANTLGPLVVKLFFEKKYPELKKFIKELLNFQISFTIYFFVTKIAIFSGIGVLFFIAVVIIWIVQTIKAFCKINEYDYTHKYPMTINFIK